MYVQKKVLQVRLFACKIQRVEHDLFLQYKQSSLLSSKGKNKIEMTSFLAPYISIECFSQAKITFLTRSKYA
ncbi:unnamed protein product [Rhizophagus irregularis]|nr:unnamed protein product [Rhizophagus irregularis]